MILSGDLVEQDVDAIVNAANNDLVLGAASMSLGGRTTAQSLQSSMDECAIIMARCLRDALISGWAPEEVRFVLFDDDSSRAFEVPFTTFFKAPF